MSDLDIQSGGEEEVSAPSCCDQEMYPCRNAQDNMKIKAWLCEQCGRALDPDRLDEKNERKVPVAHLGRYGGDC